MSARVSTHLKHLLLCYRSSRVPCDITAFSRFRAVSCAHHSILAQSGHLSRDHHVISPHDCTLLMRFTPHDNPRAPDYISTSLTYILHSHRTHNLALTPLSQHPRATFPRTPHTPATSPQSKIMPYLQIRSFHTVVSLSYLSHLISPLSYCLQISLSCQLSDLQCIVLS